MQFRYTGRNASGTLVRGSVETNTQEEAIQLLQKKGLVLTNISAEGENPDILQVISKYWDGVRTKDLIMFFRQITALINAKVPLLNAIRTLQNQTDSPYFRSVIGQIADDVEDGTPLSESMQKHEAFDSFIISLVRSGEVSGKLGESIAQIADNMESNYELNAKIRGAMLYPTVILIATVAVGIFVLSYIIPKIALIVKDLAGDKPLPWYTTVVMGAAEFMGTYWWAVVLLLVGSAAGAWYYIHTESGREEWDKAILKLPVFGKLAKNVYIARFGKNFSSLIQGGLPVVQALIIVSDVVNNTHYKAIILKGAENVKKGGFLSESFSRESDVPSMVTQMITIGEETGNLSQTLDHVSNFYLKEADRITKNLTSLIEPFLIIFLGVGVGFLVLSVLVPIFSISSFMN